MKQFFLAAFAAISLVTAPFTLTSCSDDDSPEISINGNGITSQTWSNTYQADSKGESVTFTFTAADAWTAVVNTTWCQISPARGREGNSQITVTIEPNTDSANRTATITIQVAGAKDRATITITQSATEQGSNTGTYSDVNSWMLSFMQQNYLWNEPLANFTPDYSLSYDKFLNAMLDHVDADNHRNRDDGHWTNGSRDYYYSFVESDAPTSRAVGEEETGSGITYLVAAYLDANYTSIGLLPALVAPGTPAAEAGVKRGDIVTKINGTSITASNYVTMANQLYSGGINVTTATIQGNTLVENTAVYVGHATFVDPAVYKSSILTTQSGKEIGYLAYMGFDIQFDAQLIDIFSQFKTEGVTDLILDLRYNGGGHVLSSVLLGTLIAGNDKAGQTYCRTTYNASRTAKGEVGDYQIGNAQTPERNYPKISEALSSSLGLKTIYVICSENTASASELIINGLRGLDLTVNLIGTTTNGKNVGMEAVTRTFGQYEYLFAPITFYSENAKGFKDYSNGFTPDLEFDDSEYYFGDFGTTDDLYTYLAIQWINNGTKPSANINTRAVSFRHTLRKLTPGTNEYRTPTRNTRGMIAFPEQTCF